MTSPIVAVSESVCSLLSLEAARYYYGGSSTRPRRLPVTEEGEESHYWLLERQGFQVGIRLSERLLYREIPTADRSCPEAVARWIGGTVWSHMYGKVIESIHVGASSLTSYSTFCLRDPDFRWTQGNELMVHQASSVPYGGSGVRCGCSITAPVYVVGAHQCGGRPTAAALTNAFSLPHRPTKRTSPVYPCVGTSTGVDVTAGGGTAVEPNGRSVAWTPSNMLKEEHAAKVGRHPISAGPSPSRLASQEWSNDPQSSIQCLLAYLSGIIQGCTHTLMISSSGRGVCSFPEGSDGAEKVVMVSCAILSDGSLEMMLGFPETEVR